MGPDGDGVSILNKNDGIFGEEFLLLLRATAGDFPPHVDGDGIGGVGGDVNGAEINVHDQLAAGQDLESFVGLFLGRGECRAGGQSQQEQGQFHDD